MDFILFVYSLFNDVISTTQTMYRLTKGDKWMMNLNGRGRKRSWRNFKVLSRHLSGGTEKTHD
jgi:hypothetical protein